MTSSELPGTLDWVPIHDRLDLLAPVVIEAIPPTTTYVAPIDPDLADTATFCAEYGVGLEESANCVIVEGRRGDNTTLAAVVVRATQRADVNKTIRKHLGVRKASFAPMDTATSLTHMEYGGITPMGLPTGWPLLVDQGLVHDAWFVIGSGLRGSKIAIRGETLTELPGAEVLELTVR